jgi:hypothetical protein
MRRDSFDCPLRQRNNTSFMGATTVTRSGRVAGGGGTKVGRCVKAGRCMSTEAAPSDDSVVKKQDDEEDN